MSCDVLRARLGAAHIGTVHLAHHKKLILPDPSNWGYGATAARLTRDQKVGSSNFSPLTYCHSMNAAMIAFARARILAGLRQVAGKPVWNIHV